MKKIFFISILTLLSSSIVYGAKTQQKKTGGRQYVDLESLDIIGLIDRPKTMYIIKKSDTEFKDNFADYDYVNAIIEPTYSEPF